jgi:ubiquinone/menaquinone biosynthesis C-methylase UbiE
VKKQSYFDKRGATYDRDELHHRIVALLIEGVEIKPGWSILDIATGTGLLALEAAQQVGPSGKVIGVDLSKGMLAEAQQKAAATKLSNIEFVQQNAEQLAFPHKSFDCIFCSSAIVLMSDIPLALRHWFNFLKPQGLIAFDTPAKPFGISQRVADIAARYGIHLTYADIADTPTKCCSLLEESGFEVVDVRTEFANSRPIELGKAIAFWDERIDHPAWEPLDQAQPKIRETMRTEYIDSITADAVAGYVPNDTALNFVFGFKRS